MEEFEEYEEYEEFEEDEEGMERMDPDGEVEQDDGDSFTFAGEDDEDGEESWGGGAADDLGGIGMEEDAVREVATGGLTWGETALSVATQVLASPPMAGVELYLFRALGGGGSRKLEIRLDKLTDVYGSPSSDDIDRFCRLLLDGMRVAFGEEASGEIGLEVSSPGAERLVQVPRELARFGGLPLKVRRCFGGLPPKVEYTETPVVPASTESSPSADSTATAASSSSSSSKGTVAPTGSITTAILELVEFDEALGTSEWKLADVKANASTKGRKMSKRQLAQRIPILLASVVRARVYVDF
ncbi:MAG: hypothetical protein WDW36_007549 [Sanguina aurantia]